MPDLRELRAFVAVAEHLNFTRAAEQLHLTQQTVSKTIRDLEAQLGVELLERTSQQVRLTPAGQTLLEPARDVLVRAQDAFDAVRAVGGGLSGTVRVGVTPAIGPHDLHDVVRVLRDGTDRAVAFRDLRPSELRQALRDRDVDIVLARVSGTVADDLQRGELRPTPMQVHVADAHPVTGAATLADFDGARVLTASPRGTPYTELLVTAFAQAGATVTPVEARVTGGAQLLTELVAPDVVAPMPVGTASPPGVRHVAVADFTVPLLVLWRAGTPSDAAGRLLQELGR